MQHPILPTCYFGNLYYFTLLQQNPNAVIEAHEHFPKQSYRNRCEILGPNGVQNLIVPVERHGKKIVTKELTISNAEPWQKQHWRSLVTAYNPSPYFMHYEHELKPFFEKPYTYLLDLNQEITAWLCEQFSIAATLKNSESYTVDSEQDYRNHFKPNSQINFTPQRYIQVFEDRHPFAPNLSMLDYLFNCGPKI